MTEKSWIEERFRAIEENYKEIEETLCAAASRAGRRREEIRFMAVTKTVEPICINHALSLGIGLIGENKVQELLSKLEHLPEKKPEMHLIGHLQSNKVRKIVGVADMIQSVDSLTLADEISRQAVLHGTGIDVLLEVNIGEEAAKTGFPPEALADAFAAIREKPGVSVRGLMCVPPVCETETEVRRYFAKTRRLFEDMRDSVTDGPKPEILSMGMSSDYAAAVLEGSTLVRVGSALFGMRRY